MRSWAGMVLMMSAKAAWKVKAQLEIGLEWIMLHSTQMMIMQLYMKIWMHSILIMRMDLLPGNHQRQ